MIFSKNKKNYSCAFWDNPSDTFCDIQTQPDGERCVNFTSEAGCFSLFLMESDSMEGLWQMQGKLLGTAPMPSPWSLGYHQSRWSYLTQQDTEQVSSELIKNDMPCDSVWLDIDYADEKRYFTWNKKKF